MHCFNAYLPEEDIRYVAVDDENNAKDIRQCLDQLKNGGDVQKTIGRLSRLARSRIQLKYSVDIKLLSDCMSTLYQTFLTTVSFTMKSKILVLMMDICKKKKYPLEFTYDWSLLWENIVDIILRKSKSEHSNGEAVVLHLVEDLSNFLHATRRFLSKQDGRVIAEKAKLLLSDLRVYSCLEGVILLVTCLPTDFDYDDYLPEWAIIWQGIPHNVLWDLCWFTLFTRARKYSTTFDWSSLLPLFLVKARELMGFPASKPALHEFPFEFTSNWAIILTTKGDRQKTALMKLSKLIYFCTTLKSLTLVHADPLTITPPISCTSAATEHRFAGFHVGAEVSFGTGEIAVFFQTIRPFLYASNDGGWTRNVVCFVATFVSEMARHCGRTIGYSLSKHSENSPFRGELHLNFHAASVEYLSGMCLLIAMEGLYGKDALCGYIYGASMKNLISINHNFGYIVMPFLLAALDPAASNQSHQAPAALQALTACSKSLLYPTPVLIKFLPTLLQLILPGLDPCDPHKTELVSNLITNIFTWVPIRSDYSGCIIDASNTRKSCSDLLLRAIDHESGTASVGIQESYADNFREIYENLGSVMSDWIPAFFDKVFAVFDAQEVKQKGPRSNRVNRQGISVQVCSSVAAVSQAILCPVLRASMEQHIISHFLTNSPLNAAKAVGKLFDNICFVNPNLLERVVKSFLTSEVLTIGSMSSEKLAFRLRLLGGAVRSSDKDAVAAQLPNLQQLFTPQFIHHTDKEVRKMAGKLLKDTVRAGTSFSAIVVSPMGWGNNRQLEENFNLCDVGATSIAKSLKMASWQVPGGSSLSAIIHLMKTLSTQAISDLQGSLNSISIDCSGESAKIQLSAAEIRNLEVRIVTNLKLLRYLVRGAAEVLGDLGSHATSTEFTFVESLDVGEKETFAFSSTVHSGRDAVLPLLNPEERVYLSELRFQLLGFLVRMHQLLPVVGSQADSTKSLSDSESTSDLSVGGTNAAAPGSSPEVRRIWMKLLRTIVVHRMAWKDAAKIAQGMSQAKKTTRSLVHKTIDKVLESRECRSGIFGHDNVLHLSSEGGKLNELVHTSYYWKQQDISCFLFAGRVQVHLSLRLTASSFASLRSSLHDPIQQPAYSTVLWQLYELCCHHYDALRNRAKDVFVKVSSRYGWMHWLHSIVLPAMRTISNSTSLPAVYSVLEGALTLLKSPRVMNRLVTQWYLTERLLTALLQCPAVIGTVAEPDKREKLMTSLTKTFVQYAVTCEDSPMGLLSDSSFLQQALGNFGIDLQSGAMNSLKSVSVSIRNEIFIGYSLLHLIGHNNSIPQPGMWTWALQTLTASQNPPMQKLALYALTKLTYNAYAREERKQITMNSETRRIVRDYFDASTSGSVKAVWTEFLHGMASNPPSAGGGQWSPGVQELIHHAGFYGSIVPASFFQNFDFHHNFSKKFMCTNAGLIFSLVTTFHQSDSNDWLSVDYIKLILESSLLIPSSNEDETIANNSTRAELFCGLYIACYTAMSKELELSNSSRISVLEEIEKLLTEFMLEQVEKSSVEYMKVWADGVYFAGQGWSVSKQKPFAKSYLARNILDGLRAAIGLPRVLNSTTELGQDDGFTRNEKRMMLTCLLLKADLAVVHKEQSITTSLVGNEILACLSNVGADLVSPFRTVRRFTSSLISVLLSINNDTIGAQISAICQRILPPELRESVKDEEPINVNNNNSAAAMEVVETALLLGPLAAAPRTDVILNDGAASTPVSNTPTTAISDPKEQRKKNGFEMHCTIMNFLVVKSTLKQSGATAISLLHSSIVGSGSSSLELAKDCHASCKSFIKFLQVKWSDDESSNVDLFRDTLQLLQKLSTFPSFHVRETVMICSMKMMSDNWQAMNDADRKLCRDIFASGLVDVKPEVTALAMMGMSCYLSSKSVVDLQKVATVYVKNCDILAARERQKKRAGGVVAKPDDMYLNTVLMTACLVLAFPYDMPPFMPALVTALVKHLTIPAVQTAVTKTVQTFKRSHQDRWEDFKLLFSHEQLDDLQGAAAAHYFS